jgi:predicted transcriptional regulator YheO
MNRPWTKNEEQFLIDRYLTESTCSIASSLNRSKSAIRSRAFVLDLVKHADATESEIPQARMLKVFDLIKILRNEQSNVESLAKAIDSSERTVYRYLKLIEAIGFPLEESFHGNFFIADDCVCPLCIKI